MSNKSSSTVGSFLLTMMYISTILSIRNWPMSAEYGLSSIVILLLAAFTFLIPVGLVSADLASKWPDAGGIYAWVKLAFGSRWGFIATWFVWISNIVWYPTLLSFIGSAMVYGFSTTLAHNHKVLFLLTIISFWILTWLNLNKLKISGWFNTACLLAGTILPAAFLICFGMYWVYSGEPICMELSKSHIFPQFTKPSTLVFFSGLLLGFAGMEMPAVHANEVKNPRRSFPKAIYFSTLIILIFSILGTFVVGALLPVEKINFVTASLDAIEILLTRFGLSSFLPIISILVAGGALGGVSSWIAGPSKGLLTAASEFSVPNFIKRVNQHNRPSAILILQAILVSLLACVFLIMPSITASFWILTVLASQLYLITYIILFASAIYLRFKYPETSGKYRISRSNTSFFFVCGIGLLGALFSLSIGFMPPEQIDIGSHTFYVSFLLLGILLSTAVPAFLKPLGYQPKLSKR